MTHSGAVLGTPSYMAPEQAQGQKVGPAADVYALGAILYECLTCRPPFLAENALETLAQVVAQEPVPPSRLNAKVPRDLETICLKALAKLPARRYASAADLAADLERYLDGRPIVARPVSMAERTVKWARRRPAVAGSLALVVAVTLTSLGVITRLYRDAVREAERAEQQKDRAVASLKLVGGAATVLVNLGFAQGQADRDPEAIARYEAARDLFRRLVKESPDGDFDDPLATTCTNLGTSLAALNRQEEALAAFREAIAIRRTRLADQPDSRERRAQLAFALAGKAHSLIQLRRVGEALPDLDEAIALFGADGENAAQRRFAHGRRAEALGQVGRHRDALPDWDVAVALTPTEGLFPIRLSRADALARAGEHRRAAAEADELERASGLPEKALYDLACVHALCAAHAAKDAAASPPEREKLAEGRARAAVRLLERGHEAGHFRGADFLAHFAKDADLDGLRGRDDFRRLARRLAGQKPPQPR
jgi:tetratricopeptide (TPR) repeat protein